jgi:hypothetical protein
MKDGAVKTRLRTALVSAILLATVAAPQVSADGLSATLDGKRIRISRVPTLNCHDFDQPVIRCFSTPDLLASDIEARTNPALAEGARLLSAGWVTAYHDHFFGTPSISLSGDWPSLSVLGWNDRISSFKSFGATGGFWEHSPSGGFFHAYGSTTQTPSLGSHNDAFSAFVID